MRSTALPLIGLTALCAAGACAPLRSHQGYVMDADLVNSVQPGVDTRQSVLDTLGTPTFTSQFNKGDWFYLARDSRNVAYRNPKAVSQITLRIHFDDKGTVASVQRTGLNEVAKIRPDKKTTPTLGHKNSFFEAIFGNIGSVGAPGTTGGSGGTPSNQP